jgi:DNA-binding MarR family transcriptional regulator
MQPLELTGMQWEPLLMLWLGRADTVAGLARVIQMGDASMSRMLDRLERRTWCGASAATADRRVVNLHLTAKGRKVANRSGPSWSTACTCISTASRRTSSPSSTISQSHAGPMEPAMRSKINFGAGRD